MYFCKFWIYIGSFCGNWMTWQIILGNREQKQGECWENSGILETDIVKLTSKSYLLPGWEQNENRNNHGGDRLIDKPTSKLMTHFGSRTEDGLQFRYRDWIDREPDHGIIMCLSDAICSDVIIAWAWRSLANPKNLKIPKTKTAMSRIVEVL